MALDPGRPPDQGESTPDQHPTSPPPGLSVDSHGWVLQAIMELQRSVGALSATVDALSATVKGLTGTVEKQSEKVGANHDRLIELAAVRFARWMAGISVALISALIGLIGLVLYRLPAIIEAFRGAAPGS
jgi:hypothetical protein